MATRPSRGKPRERDGRLTYGLYQSSASYLTFSLVRIPELAQQVINPLASRHIVDESASVSTL